MKEVTLKNLNNGKLQNEKVGFAWPALLFNCLYLLYRKDWITFGMCLLLNFLFCLLPAGWYGLFFLLTNVAICLRYNKIRIEYLLSHGWCAADKNTDQILLNNNIHTDSNKNMIKGKPINNKVHQSNSNEFDEKDKITAEKAKNAISALSYFGGIHCPRCFSKNVQVIGQHKKGFSFGKAIAGTALAGGIGSLAGFAGKKTKKVDMICLNCGKKFRK